MNDYKQIIKDKIAKKNQQLAIARNLYQSLLENPQFYQNELELRKAILNGDTENITKFDILKTQILNNLDIESKLLNPIVDCTLCDDTGFHNGMICQCIKLISANKFWSQHSYLKSCTFDKLKLEFYSNPEIIKTLIERLLGFCQKFPNTRYSSLVLSGNTGTGKTYLSACIANRLIEQSASVVYVSAMQFVQSMTKYHTTFDDTQDQYFTPFVDCDMLIIDDLGTESMFKNITLEYLYLVISQRLSNKKHILITTNLDKSGIEYRYGMRIASRLYDSSLCFAFHFDGKDNRIIN
ncbi:MAG: ATP-binding protein [Firmicutes bacterium]|nr:ATP-binding protein [Bacillota bacterium]MCL1954104.1 ATP-binding protein [Bacillota bacterium]